MEELQRTLQEIIDALANANELQPCPMFADALSKARLLLILSYRQ